MEEQKMIVLAEYGRVMEAELALSYLQAGGIEARIDNEYAATLYPTGAVPARLMVRMEDARRAAELLKLPGSAASEPGREPESKAKPESGSKSGSKSDGN